MKLIGNIFDNRTTKKLFEAERYTSQEIREFMGGGKPIQSRNNRRIMYTLREGKIQLIEKR